METTCPGCGRQTAAEATACPNCGHAMPNGAVPQAPTSVRKPPPPPEVSTWVIYPTPPEVIEWARRTFNEEEFMAELRQAEKDGWPELKDFIHELEQEAPPRD